MHKPVILLLEPDTNLREAFQQILENGLGQHFAIQAISSPEEGQAQVQTLRSKGQDLATLVFCLESSQQGGEQFLANLADTFPYAELVITYEKEQFEQLGALINKAGVRKILPKSSARDHLVEAVRTAASHYQQQAQFEEFNRLLRWLAEAIQEITGQHNTQQVLDRLLLKALQLSEADEAFLLLEQEGQLALQALRAATDAHTQQLQQQSQQAPAQFSQQLVQQIQQVLQGAIDDRCYSIVALSDRANMPGYLFLRNSQGEAISANSREILALLVAQASVSLESASLYQSVSQRSQELEEVNQILKEKNQDITDSIRYAQGIQQAILPPRSKLDPYIANSFVIYRPRDYVSGDIYWFGDHDEDVLISAIDCTGHGVPGALMSIIAYSFLNQIVNEYQVFSPEAVLSYLDMRLREALKQEELPYSQNDGMDMAFLRYQPEKGRLTYCGAQRPLYLVRNRELTEFRGEKYSIGGDPFSSYESVQFENHTIPIQKGDSVYICSDGYPDQIGGPNGVKMGSRKLKELLVALNGEEMAEQHNALSRKLDSWMEGYEQVDDILLIGLRF
jgi:serine phosphatase RsbU (regulator of sigma subunit)/DNA-binding NarL/FixJ family response regulator